MSSVSEEETFEDDITDAEKIRSEISSMSFEDLQKLKQKIGAKVYNKTVFSVSNTNERKSLKRANKNRPQEISSKIKVKPIIKHTQKKQQFARDPRFDPLCGKYDESDFKYRYKFVDDIRKNEREVLKKELQKEEDPEKQNKIKLLIQRIDNQIRNREQSDKKRAAEYEEKQQRRITHGSKPPIFKKKSEKRLEDLVDQFEELKKTSKLEKHIERRSKKLASKDRKRMELEK